MYVLGVSGNFGRAAVDASAVLLCDGNIVAAAEEERFVRTKHAPATMAEEAVRYVLREGGVSLSDVVLAFPQTTWGEEFERRLRAFCDLQFGEQPRGIEFVEHHVAHAASAYRYSGFDDAIVVTADWSGDGVAASVCVGQHGKLSVHSRLDAPLHSLGVYYAAMTQYLGFKKWEDEYKVMGLASYGEPNVGVGWMLEGPKSDVPWRLAPETLSDGVLAPYPATHGLQEPTFSPLVEARLGRHRVPGQKMTKRYQDVAASVQARLELVMCDLVRELVRETGISNVCLSGGVGLNCSVNGKVLRMDEVEALYVPPVPNDAGTALGAAAEVALAYGETLGRLDTAALGPSYSDDEVAYVLDRAKLQYERVDDPAGFAAEAVAFGGIVGWFQGRMEYGARALGNRSILADARVPDMRDRINHWVKFREDFRPLAPSVLEERADDLFVAGCPSPWMTVTFTVREAQRAVLPAVTHVDGTARPQTVTAHANPLYRRLIEQFEQGTSVPVVLNTSLNVMGDPIAMRPEHAVATFASTGLDFLVIGSYVLRKKP